MQDDFSKQSDKDSQSNQPEYNLSYKQSIIKGSSIDLYDFCGGSKGQRVHGHEQISFSSSMSEQGNRRERSKSMSLRSMNEFLDCFHKDSGEFFQENNAKKYFQMDLDCLGKDSVYMYLESDELVQLNNQYCQEPEKTEQSSVPKNVPRMAKETKKKKKPKKKKKTQSDHPNSKNIHQCCCNGKNKQNSECNHSKCSCYIYLNQKCIPGLCCEKCLQEKNRLRIEQSEVQDNMMIGQGVKKHLKVENVEKPSKLSKTSKFQKTNEKLEVSKSSSSKKSSMVMEGQQGTEKKYINKFDYLYCSCKKTQCLKKYCQCYAMNRYCQKRCNCCNCQNLSESQSSEEQNSPLNKKQSLQEKKGRKGMKPGKQVVSNITFNKSIQTGKMWAEVKSSDSIECQLRQIQQTEKEIDEYFDVANEIKHYENLEMNLEMTFQSIHFEDHFEFQKESQG